MIVELIAIAFFAAFVAALTLFSGFGLGTLLLPAFAFILPADVAVGATAVVHLVNNAFKGVLLSGDADWRLVARFGGPAIAAALFGALVLETLAGMPPAFDHQLFGKAIAVTPLSLCIGALILVFALLELAGLDRRLRVPEAWLPLGGILSGFFGGLSGHQGALRAVFLAPLGLSAAAFAATQAVIAIGVDVTRLLVYGAAGLDLDKTALPVVGAGIAGAIAGALLGRKLLPKVTFNVVHRVTAALLFITGTGMMLGLI